VNGYDFPFSSHLSESHDHIDRIKSVPYARHDWSAGVVEGDRVVGPSSKISRAANMMSRRPKLQVLGHRRCGSSGCDRGSGYVLLAYPKSHPRKEQGARASTTRRLDATLQEVQESTQERQEDTIREESEEGPEEEPERLLHDVKPQERSSSQAEVVQDAAKQHIFGGLRNEGSPNWHLFDETTADPQFRPSSSQDLSATLGSSMSDSIAVSGALASERPSSWGALHTKQSTPPRSASPCTEIRSSAVACAIACSEMGFRPANYAQGSSGRSSSEESTLRLRRVTGDSNLESFHSSGVDEDFSTPSDATFDRIARIEEEIEREIIVMQARGGAGGEQRADLSGGSGSGERTRSTDMEEDVEEVIFAPYPYERVGGDRLEPVEEVTEEPTLSALHGDSTWADLDDDVVEAEWPTGFEVPPIHGPTREEVARNWARIHGIATPTKHDVNNEMTK
jgi:hypothetical protein